MNPGRNLNLHQPCECIPMWDVSFSRLSVSWLRSCGCETYSFVMSARPYLSNSFSSFRQCEWPSGQQQQHTTRCLRPKTSHQLTPARHLRHVFAVKRIYTELQKQIRHSDLLTRNPLHQTHRYLTSTPSVVILYLILVPPCLLLSLSLGATHTMAFIRSVFQRNLRHSLAFRIRFRKFELQMV
jgi:hypothetical protein